MSLTVYEFIVTDILFVRIEFANKEDWNKLVMAAKMVSDPNIQVKLGHTKSIANSANIQIKILR